MRVENSVAFPEGAMTLLEGERLLREGEQALAQGVMAFDLTQVTQVDSTAVSLLLAWRRRAQDRARPLDFRNIPDSLHSLTRLYGLADLVH